MLKFLNLSLLLIIISGIILFFNSSEIFGELGNTSSPLSSPTTTTTTSSSSPSSFSSNHIITTYSKLSPTYKIDITTGSGLSYKFQHFYPLKITIPLDTTVAWFNSDPEQIHTVTSSSPGAANSGKLFNSGIIPYSSSFQYTFEQPGIISYHCEIHPWMIGSVYVSDSTKQGKNFKLSTGTRMGELDNASQNNDWIFNTTDTDRILFNIQPISIKTDKNTTMTYNMQIYNSQLNKEILSQAFFVKGNDLQFELLASDLDEPLVYGPDFSDPITGAYHIREKFPNGDYILMIEITAIGSTLTQTKIVDVFKGKIISS